MPGPFSTEAGLIYAQGALLVARSLLTDYVSMLEGRAGRWIIQVGRLPGCPAAWLAGCLAGWSGRWLSGWINLSWAGVCLGCGECMRDIPSVCRLPPRLLGCSATLTG